MLRIVRISSILPQAALWSCEYYYRTKMDKHRAYRQRLFIHLRDLDLSLNGAITDRGNFWDLPGQRANEQEVQRIWSDLNSPEI